ncbi:hypothetical protein O181_001188 [Austropuccinia psidii MF-1]|uniref:Tet-like 2OG-Fe(II) oxygenase domain-containing protein n=1 Tax=Austropuccinia psidii MF-1 TaxID=1389203 RepID=A0A9Q3BAA2_9BASI|nr:hypothetical protein [Austropuccinia psidii MF-1]
MVKIHQIEEVNIENSTANKLSEIIHDLYKMAKDRPHQDKNGPLLGGMMKCIGFRTGMDKGKSAGVYARLPNLSNEAIDYDNYLWDKLDKHNEFISARFNLFSKLVTMKNNELMKEFKLPNWSSPEWKNESNNQEFSLFSNCSITYNDFHNKPHCDHDFNPYTYGIFSYIHPETGNVREPKAKVDGYGFYFNQFDCMVDFGKANGILEIVWPSFSIEHQTTKPPIECKTTGDCTHFGSSFQVNEKLANIARRFQKNESQDFSSRILGRQERDEKKYSK